MTNNITIVKLVKILTAVKVQRGCNVTTVYILKVFRQMVHCNQFGIYVAEKKQNEWAFLQRVLCVFVNSASSLGEIRIRFQTSHV